MKVWFLGTGTSMGIPMVGCRCTVCRSRDPRDRRLRASVLLEVAGQRLLIDAAVDFRQQALRFGIDDLDAVLFTHHHADHIFGLDDLRPINIFRAKDIPVYGSANTLENLRRVYSYVFRAGENESDVPRIRPVEIEREAFQIGPVTVQPVPLWHGRLPILGFRIGGFAYCTDVSAIPEESGPLLADLEVLVLGALRHRPHPTHFTIEQAVEAARQIGARQTYFTHLSHEVAHAELEALLPAGMAPAYDGQVVEIRRERWTPREQLSDLKNGGDINPT